LYHTTFWRIQLSQIGRFSLAFFSISTGCCSAERIVYGGLRNVIPFLLECHTELTHIAWNWNTVPDTPIQNIPKCSIGDIPVQNFNVLCLLPASMQMRVMLKGDVMLPHLRHNKWGENLIVKASPRQVQSDIPCDIKICLSNGRKGTLCRFSTLSHSDFCVCGFADQSCRMKPTEDPPDNVTVYFLCSQPAAGGPAKRKAQRHTDWPGRPSNRRSSLRAQKALPRASGNALHVLTGFRRFTLLRTAVMRMFLYSLDSEQPPPYGSHLTSANLASSLERRKDAPPPRPLPNPPAPAWPRVPPSTGSSSQQIQQRISVPPSPTFQPNIPLFPPMLSERLDPPPAVAVRPFIPDRGTRPQSPRKGPPTVNSSSIYHMYLQQAAPKSQPLKPAVKAVYGKPLLPSSSTPASPLPYVQAGGAFPALQGLPGSDDSVDGELHDQEGFQRLDPSAPPPSVENIPRPLSPTKLTPMVHSPLRYQSDADLELLRKKLANAPRPLKKRSSITEPEGPSGPNIQKLLYQRFNTLAGGIEGNGGSGSGGSTGAGNGTPFYQPAIPPGYLGGDSLADTNNGNLLSETQLPPPPGEDGPGSEAPSTTDANDNEPMTSPPKADTDPGEEEEPEDNTNNNVGGSEASLPSPVPEVSTPEESGTAVSQQLVENPSTPNDEGITPLHNAVCAGHHHIVKFLLDFGVNVNAADSDGCRTPLHCAASCNSVHLCKLLVESGAAIFASTISDVETAADKCEEMEEGFIQCSQFLYGVQEKLGVMNKGTVYALWDYDAQSPDELSFREGDAITILRRQDENETEWWWSRLEDKEGYVPRNLLGVRRNISLV
ncbi:hypothetical protein GOODEAATRI_003295, partial [Goodea atripinnis]